MRYLVVRHGTMFSTRERGAAVRAEIEAAARQATPFEPIVVDFAGVELTGFSFADEVTGRVYLDRMAGQLGNRIVLVANANVDVLDQVERSLDRRQLIGAYVEKGSVRLLGAPEHLQQTFAAARRRGQFRTRDLAADLGISVAACNNRLKPLLEAGLLTRAPGIPRSGGREFVYRVALPQPGHELEVA
ncbi:MAG: DUF4325 domain-containing protein [Chloroflexi bacterium]|nr:DUF4325 domain-containing protein [Chloroflexota bacterium]